MRFLLGPAYPYIESRCEIKNINEIRIRLGQKILIKTLTGELYIPFVADEFFINGIIDAATGGSRYAFEDTIGEGYIDYTNGIRIGISGEGWNNGSKNILRKFYSLCIRIPRQVVVYPDIPAKLYENFDNTIIVSPPGGGKTTLLREFIYRLAKKYDVFAIDERFELFGKNMFVLPGKHCDISQGVPKKFLYETAIRTMAPSIVACDELFGEEDFAAIASLINAGVKVIATLHGEKNIPTIIDKLFKVKIYLSSIPSPGSIKSIEEN